MTLRDQRGFTIVELMVSTFIMLVVTAAVFGLVNPSTGTYRAQPEVSDMQQRLRMAANALQQDLVMAGAGTYLGGSGGSLLNFFAPIMPMRIGTLNSDIPANVFYRPDTITIMYVPQTASQTTIAEPMPPTSAELKVETIRPGCPPQQPNQPCGFKSGMRAVIFDDGGFDTFTITNVQNSDHLQHNKEKFTKQYEKGSQVAAIATQTYYLKSEPSTETFQLRLYDGYQTDVPLVDNVVALAFDYLGDPRPPMLLPKALADPVGPWTTYGPKPPGLASNPQDAWDVDGENCVFRVEGGQHVPRLTDLAAGKETLVKLEPAALTDGPFCPDGASESKFDADLLRIRSVDVRLRVQVASARMRGPAGVLFTRGGSSDSGMTFVPDQEIHFSVSPRNMNLGR